MLSLILESVMRLSLLIQCNNTSLFVYFSTFDISFQNVFLTLDKFCLWLLVSYYLSLFKSCLFLQCHIFILEGATVTYTLSSSGINKTFLILILVLIWSHCVRLQIFFKIKPNRFITH